MILLSSHFVSQFVLSGLYYSFVCCSCVPLHNFDYVYDYLMGANLSFIDW
jgi:hypothetical protein